MESIESLQVKYDGKTKRVEVTYQERRVLLPSTHDTPDEAHAAAEAYARRWMVKK